MKNAQVMTFIDKLKDELATPEYEVLGWSFVLDDPNKFNPHCQESADIAGFPHRLGMAQGSGMFYVSEEYGNYLDVLRETGTEHPANIYNLEWIEQVENDSLPTI
ncbi:hypothetical protein ACLHDG_06640 [Sulfurovum sp. CS9]|uniref:hypothetical protein n=1 Tax=Sulfurovum sp. CS9 TaxID=3391146 RepID=UPI0039E88969